MSLEVNAGAKQQHEVALRLGAALQQGACPQVGPGSPLAEPQTPLPRLSKLGCGV